MRTKLLATCILLLAGCGSPSEPNHADVANGLDTIAVIIEQAAADDNPEAVAKALRTIAGWVRNGFKGNRTQLREAVALVRAVVIKSEALGAKPQPELLQALALADAWLQVAP